jgi:hypothetical protein
VRWKKKSLHDRLPSWNSGNLSYPQSHYNSFNHFLMDSAQLSAMSNVIYECSTALGCSLFLVGEILPEN